MHNQRIERSWVDVWNGATNLYYDLFHFLEQIGSLDVDNSSHVWALHYIFLPRLNRELQAFQQQWNNHGLRTEHHETPLQLFVGRSLELANSQLTAMQDLFQRQEEPQCRLTEQSELDLSDWDESALALNASNVKCPLTPECLQELEQKVNPQEHSDELGMELYLKVLNFIIDHPQ